MKVLLVGSPRIAEILARQLSYYGVNVSIMLPSRFPNPASLIKHDVIYGVYLYDAKYAIAAGKFLGKRTVLHIVGSDAVVYAKYKRLRERLVLRLCDKILYVSKETKEIVGLDGEIMPIPIDTKMFRPPSHRIPEEEKRDILYYCPSPEIYRLNWIMNYARTHLDEKITLIGRVKVNLPNVEVIKDIDYKEIPSIYHRHRKLIRMTTRDGMPKMPYEALLCGLEVIWNGKKVTEFPNDMIMENTIPRLINIFKCSKT